jgi:hypothetical protein
MPITSSPADAPVEGTIVRIRDDGRILELDYDGAMTHHGSSLWWGTAVGFRAMQMAAHALSTRGLWTRDQLYIVSAHPGPGVRDAINYVTRTFDRGRFTCVEDGNCGGRCHSSMKFEWWVSDGTQTAAIQLRPDFVPASFYHLSDRLGLPETTPADKLAFDIFKVNLSARIWNAALADSFRVEVTSAPLAVGEIPAPIKAASYWDRTYETASP